MKKRILSLLLAAVTVMSAVPLALLPVTATDTQTSALYDEAQYDALYVQDGLTFKYDFFDAVEGDEAPADGVLYDQNGVKLTAVPLSGAAETAQIEYGNGYLTVVGGGKVTLTGALAVPDKVAGETHSATNTTTVVMENVKHLPYRTLSYATGDSGAAYFMRFSSINQSNMFSIGGVRFSATYITDDNIADQLAYNKYIVEAQNDAAKQLSFSYPVRPADLAALKELETNGTVAAGAYITTVNGPGEEQATWAGFQYIISGNGLNKNSNYYYYRCTTDLRDNDYVFNANISKNVLYWGNQWLADLDETVNSISGRSFTAREYGEVYALSVRSQVTYSDSGCTLDSWKLLIDTEQTAAMGPKTTNATLDGTQSGFYLSDFSAKIYAIRTYNRNLTDEELVQNSFADIAKFYALDLTDYNKLSDSDKAVVQLDVVNNVKLGDDAAEAIEKITDIIDALKPIEPDEYDDLYVQDGLVFHMRADHLKEGKAVAGFDRLGNQITYGASAVAGNGYVATRGGTVSVPNLADKLKDKDATYEVVFGYEDEAASKTVTNRTHKTWSIGPTSITSNISPTFVAGGGRSTYDLYAGMSDNVFNVTTLKDDGVTQSGGWFADVAPTKNLFASATGSTTSFAYIRELYDHDEYTAGKSFKITVANGEAVAINAKSGNGTYVPTPMEYIPALDKNFSFGASLNMKLYNIRVYSKALTADERQQNHFADLAAFYHADLTFFNLLDEDTKQDVIKSFAGVQLQDTSADALENAFRDAFVDLKFAPAAIGRFIGFDGFQARLRGYAALRASFTVNTAAMTALNTDYKILEIGTVLAPAGGDRTMGDLAVTWTDGASVPVSEDAEVYVMYDGDTDGFFKGTDGKDHFALAVTYKGEDIKALEYTQLMMFRTYMVVTYKAGTAEELTVVQYCDAVGDTVGDSVSMVEIASEALTANPDSEILIGIRDAVASIGDEIMVDIDSDLAAAKKNYETYMAEGGVYTSLVTQMKSYRDAIVASQFAGRHAQAELDLSAAKTAGQQTLLAATAYYNETVVPTRDGAVLAKVLEDAKALYEKIETNYNLLVSSLDQNDPLLAEASEKLAEAKLYYQGFYKELAEGDLTIKRYNTKISNAYTALNGYTVRTDIESYMYILGDSTVCPRSATDVTAGWTDYFDAATTSALNITNYAVGGWSFKGMMYTTATGRPILENYTDMENSRFGKALDEAGEGDFIVFASTSPNDLWQGGQDFYYLEDEFGNITVVEEGTPGAKYYTWKMSASDYYHALKEAIDLTLEKGATPVLVTSLGGIMASTSTGDKHTLVIDRDGVKTTYYVPYARPGKFKGCVEHYEEVKRILAEEYGDQVILIDFTEGMYELYEATYDEAIAAGKTQAEAVTAILTKYNPTSTDPTHQNKYGASLINDEIVRIVKESVPELAKYLIES